MRAVSYERHGGPEVLRVVELPEPELGPGEVRIAVRAAALNRLDLLQREGPPLIPGFSLPHIPGMDIAGEVIELGDGVTERQLGDRVLVKAGIHCGLCEACRAGETWRCQSSQLVGGNRPGGYAEQCVIPADHVSPIPDDVSWVDASTVPTAYSTAWRAMVRTGDVRIGETVLVHAAGSGVSVFAIQIAKRAGAKVIATSRSDSKLERAAELGADAGVNTTSSDLVESVQELTGGAGVDMVFDHLGPALFVPSLRSLRPGGRMVVCGTTTGAMVEVPLPAVYHAGIEIRGTPNGSFNEYRAMIEEYWELGIHAVVDSVLPLEEAAEAHRRLEGGDVFGKVVLDTSL